jgi:hypothetical protein
MRACLCVCVCVCVCVFMCKCILGKMCHYALTHTHQHLRTLTFRWPTASYLVAACLLWLPTFNVLKGSPFSLVQVLVHLMGTLAHMTSHTYTCVPSGGLA